MKKTFIFYSDRQDYLLEFTDAEAWIFLKTILKYQRWEDIWDIGNIKFIRTRVKNQLDDDNSKWEQEKIAKSKAWIEGNNKRWWDRKASQNIAPAITWSQSIAPISQSIAPIAVNVNDNVNDNVNVNDNTLKESNLYIKGVEDFIIFQKDNIPWIRYQIEKQWEDDYLQKQYQAYNKIISTNKITPLNLDRILEFVKQDKFRNKNIWSITKLLDKNKEWVPYRVVMIDKIKTKIDESPKVFKIEL